MTTLAIARRTALALPETTEEPHHEMSSFRVRGRIFATVPDDTHLHVMVAPEDVAAAVAEDAKAFEELWWGERLSGVRVNLAAADHAVVSELLADAWRRKAPKRVVSAYDERGGS